MRIKKIQVTAEKVREKTCQGPFAPLSSSSFRTIIPFAGVKRTRENRRSLLVPIGNYSLGSILRTSDYQSLCMHVMCVHRLFCLCRLCEKERERSVKPFPRPLAHRFPGQPFPLMREGERAEVHRASSRVSQSLFQKDRRKGGQELWSVHIRSMDTWI